jgi:hypothetical protein
MRQCDLARLYLLTHTHILTRSLARSLSRCCYCCSVCVGSAIGEFRSKQGRLSAALHHWCTDRHCGCNELRSVCVRGIRLVDPISVVVEPTTRQRPGSVCTNRCCDCNSSDLSTGIRRRAHCHQGPASEQSLTHLELCATCVADSMACDRTLGMGSVWSVH